MITTDEMIAWLDELVQFWDWTPQNDSQAREQQDRDTKAVNAIRDFIAKHSDPSMVLVPKIFHGDACFLSRIYNEAGIYSEQQYRINEWLKQLIVQAAKED